MVVVYLLIIDLDLCSYGFTCAFVVWVACDVGYWFTSVIIVMVLLCCV